MKLLWLGDYTILLVLDLDGDLLRLILLLVGVLQDLAALSIGVQDEGLGSTTVLMPLTGHDAWVHVGLITVIVAVL